MTYLYKLFRLMPRMPHRRSPLLSFWVGFISSFWGLGFYFRSNIDFLIAVSFSMMLLTFSLAGMQLWLIHPLADYCICALFTGLYGCLRALESNQRQGSAVRLPHELGR